MEITDKAINHKAFGNGVVTAIAEDVITVCFSMGEKKFIFPDAFENFLTLKDGTVQKQIEAMLNQKRVEKAGKALVEQDRMDQVKKMRNLVITENSQAAFDLSHSEIQQSLGSWTASVGCYLSGISKGSPRVPTRLKPNSACLLTERPDGMTEADRKITGIFMVEENFFGEQCLDGIIKSHKRFRIFLRGNENLMFWNYFSESGQLPVWGKVKVKYFSNQIMRRILGDIKRRMKDEESQQIAEEFFECFCRLNRLQA